MKKIQSPLFKNMMIVIFILALSFCLTSCKNDKIDNNQDYQKNENLDTSKKVSLLIASSKSTWAEMDYVASKFEEIYPNCTISSEYVENYTSNIAKRLEQNDLKIDIFGTTNIQATTEWKDNALNLISEEAKKTLDLSGCNEGLVKNFKYTEAENTQYAIPYGGEMRGMYVNVTLLNKLDLNIPTNRSEFLHCCEVLLANGYIPIQSHTGTFGQQLLYPYICNSIVNGGDYENMYRRIDNIEPGISEYFRDAYSFIYDIVKEGYFDFERSTEELNYTFSRSDGKARNFLNIVPTSTEEYYKVDDEGKIPFMIDTQGLNVYLSKYKEDYHSNIEYKFIATPVGVDGGYAYLSPSDGLAINRNSDNVEWALEFLNFFFTPSIHKEFAKMASKIPNTKDALIEYEIDEKHSCNVGQVTFSYQFYQTVVRMLLNGVDEGYTSVNVNYRKVYQDETYYYKSGDDYITASNSYIEEHPNDKYYVANDAMVGISKMNVKEFMIENPDGTYSLKYTLDDYITRLEKEFERAKATRDGSLE